MLRQSETLTRQKRILRLRCAPLRMTGRDGAAHCASITGLNGFALWRKQEQQPPHRRKLLSGNRVCKPGSVLDSHLSCRTVAGTLHATSPETAGPANVSSTVLLRIEFTAPDSLQPASELLPRLSTLALPCFAPAERYLSVALFLKSPSAGVTRYPCPVEPGLSSRWAFRPSRAAVRPGCRRILAWFFENVNALSK